MGRLPTHYNGKRIVNRIPYTMYSTAFLYRSALGVGLGDNFPFIDFFHDDDKPFEIHRMLPSAIDLTSAVEHPVTINGTQLTQTEYLLGADLLLRDDTKNVNLTKDFSNLAAMVRGELDRSWEWEDPYYLKRGEGLQASVRESAYTPAFTVLDHVAIQYFLSFEGFLVVVEGEEG